MEVRLRDRGLQRARRSQARAGPAQPPSTFRAASGPESTGILTLRAGQSEDRVFPGESGLLKVRKRSPGRQTDSSTPNRLIILANAHPCLSSSCQAPSFREHSGATVGLSRWGMSWRVVGVSWGDQEKGAHPSVPGSPAALPGGTRPPHAPPASHNSIENVTAPTQGHPGWGRSPPK